MKNEMKKVWDYMRFGTAGTYVKNDENGREIVRTSKYIDTLWFECNCYENGEYVMHTTGRDAVDWLTA